MGTLIGCRSTKDESSPTAADSHPRPAKLAEVQTPEILLPDFASVEFFAKKPFTLILSVKAA